MDLEIVWIIIGAILMIGGYIFCFLPVIPGPPLSYAGLLFLQLLNPPAFETRLLVILAIIAIAVSVLDVFIPVYGTKKLGGSKYGVWGSAIGLLVGIIFAPFGFVSIIIGPFLGAIVGELISGKSGPLAIRSAVGSFVGFLAGTMIKLAACVIMTYYFIDALVYHF